MTRQTIHFVEDQNIKRTTEEKLWLDYIDMYEKALRNPLNHRFFPTPPKKKSYTVRARKNRSQRPKACQVCGQEAKQICFDHCHTTGRFRGWLCGGCNSALGMVKDNPNTLRKLAEYLENG